ncbi:MAG: DUF1800 domain-containing protein [Pirellulales bacterium]
MSNHWKIYQPSTSLPWSIDRVRHLHRRAGLGFTREETERGLAAGPEISIDCLLSGSSRSQFLRDDFEEMSQVLAEAATRSDDEVRLKAWWIFRLLWTPDPLQERLTLMWHNHFATSNAKVGNLQLMLRQNQIFRQFARDKFQRLLQAVLLDPAMLIWLDSNSNRQGHPNENLARELMELFTLGVGNYTEQDVKQAARALTGWSVKDSQARFRSEQFDSADKTVLNVTQAFDSTALADHLVSQPATAQRLAWRLCDTFMGEGVVSQTAISELAEVIAASQLDIGRAVEIILRSELFFSEANIASRIISPIEFVTGYLRTLELLDRPPSTMALARWCSQLGQDLFRPPNVGGWAGGRNWLNARTIVGRANFAAALVAGELHTPIEAPDFKRFCARLANSKLVSAKPASVSRLLGQHLLSVGLTAEQEALWSDQPSELIGQLLSQPQACLC